MPSVSSLGHLAAADDVIRVTTYRRSKKQEVLAAFAAYKPAVTAGSILR